MNHSFNVDIAILYGIEEAIVMENLYFWLEKNRANKKHLIDGQVWTYNSQEAFTQLFPYMNRSKIQRVMIKLEKEGLINKANYNEKKYDKTTWYALTPHGYSLFKMNNGLFKMNNALSQNEQPIPDINSVINPDKDNVPFKEIIDYLNTKTNKNFKVNSKTTKDTIIARWNEEYTLEDFKKVIDIKTTEWNHEPLQGKEDMRAFLRPQTLFSNKFEGYLNQPVTVKEKPRTKAPARRDDF